MDEFAATLDRDTAKIVAYNVQKLARQLGKAVLAATTHTDLLEDLKPSVHIHKHFGKQIQIQYYPNTPQKECTILKQVHIQEGSTSDYKTLADFHYRSHNIGAIRKVFRAIRSDETCGIIVYSYPAIATSGRRKILPKMPVSELNQKLSNIMRVVVHPKYRTIGLGQKLVRETLSLVGTPYVETTAVMAKYNRFFERAGMTKIQETTPPKQATVIRETLAKLGFKITLLSSKKYTLSQLTHLTNTELDIVRKTFTQNAHPRFLKEFSSQPYGKHEMYKQKIQTATLEKLAKLININAMLLQTKVYLFWKSLNQPEPIWLKKMNNYDP
jgi:GNAT superfamily N-acetyltransferase